jgi:hypothetical protein
MSIASMPASSRTRRTVTTVDSYEAAERAVDWLSDKNFPMQHVAIVGTGLRYIEQVSARVTTGSAALIAGGQGATIGLFWGLLFGLFFTVDTGGFFGVLAFSVLVGLLFGALLGALTHYATKGRRDFSSEAQTRADHYEVQVDPGFAEVAEQMLAGMPAS